MKQQKLPLPTEFEMVTAEQLMIEAGGKAIVKFIDKAIKMVFRWNEARIESGLKPW